MDLDDAKIRRRHLLTGGLAGLLAGHRLLARNRHAAAATILPPAARHHDIASGNDLACALRHVLPGDHLVLADGHYDLGRLTASGTASAPIVIRAANPQKAILETAPQIDGDHIRLHGLAFGRHPLGNVHGAHLWVVRCTFTGGDDIVIRALKPGLRVWYSTFDGANAKSRAIAFDTGARADGTRGHVHRCLFTNWAPGGDNATEVITVGFSARWTHVESHTLIEECLFRDCNPGGREDETISIKSSLVTVRGCTFERTRWCQVRHGKRNLIESCIHVDSPAGGFRIRDFDSRLVNCKTMGTSRTEVFAGDSLSGEEDAGWPSTGAYPRADRCKLYNHEAVATAPRIGATFSSAFNPLRAAHQTEILGNRGLAPVLQDGNQTGTNPSSAWPGAAPVTYIPPVRLAAANVGHDAAIG